MPLGHFGGGHGHLALARPVRCISPARNQWLVCSETGIVGDRCHGFGEDGSCHCRAIKDRRPEDPALSVLVADELGARAVLQVHREFRDKVRDRCRIGEEGVQVAAVPVHQPQPERGGRVGVDEPATASIGGVVYLDVVLLQLLSDLPAVSGRVRVASDDAELKSFRWRPVQHSSVESLKFRPLHVFRMSERFRFPGITGSSMSRACTTGVG